MKVNESRVCTRLTMNFPQVGRQRECCHIREGKTRSFLVVRVPISGLQKRHEAKKGQTERDRRYSIGFIIDKKPVA